MSLYRRENSPFWQYSFTLNGVRFRGSTGRESKREAQAVEAEIRHKAKQRRTHSDVFRIRECFGAYWNEHASHKRSADFIFQKLDTLSRILGAETMITDLTNAQIMDYIAKRRGEQARKCAKSEEHKQARIQAHSVNRDLSILKAALNHANQLHGQQIPALAWKRLRTPEPPARTRFLRQEEYAALIEAADPALRLIIRFACATGLRKANILNLDWNEVDLSASLVTVNVKGDKTHTVKLTPDLRAALATINHREGLVFMVTNFRKRWYAALKTAGLEGFRFHDLRHTFASWARISGADLADIKDALGHSSVAVTMRYAHIEPETHQTAFDRVSASVWSHSATQPQRGRKRSK